MKIYAAIYIRVSTEDQVREGYSLDVQREYLVNYAKQHGDEVYEVYSDEGISAGTTDRPALQKLLTDAKQKKFDLVIVYKIDRLSRRLKDLINIVDQLESHEVAFKSATEPFDTTTSAGKLMFQQLGSFAEFERNRLAERVFPGMVKCVQAGNWHGARYCPFGYTYNKEKKLLLINKREADIVKLVFRMWLEGKNTTEIADYLNDNRYKSRVGKYFYCSFIYNILRNRLYIGQIVWNKRHYDKNQKVGKGLRAVKNDPSKIIIAQGKHEPIIPLEQFEKAQEILEQRKQLPRKKKKGKFAFSRLLYCDKCNYRYFGVSNIANHRTGERKIWYRCGGRQLHYVRCKAGAIREEILEPVILSAIKNMLDSDKFKGTCPERSPELVEGRRRGSRWMCMTGAKNDQDPVISNADLASIRNEIKSNQEKQLKLTDLYLNKSLSEATFKQKNEALRLEEEGLRSKFAGLELLLLEKEKSKDYLDRVKLFLANYDPKKKELDAAGKKEILNLIFKKIIINKSGGGALHSRISPSLFEPFGKIHSNSSFLLEERKKCGLISSKLTAGRWSGQNRWAGRSRHRPRL